MKKKELQSTSVSVRHSSNFDGGLWCFFWPNTRASAAIDQTWVGHLPCPILKRACWVLSFIKQKIVNPTTRIMKRCMKPYTFCPCGGSMILNKSKGLEVWVSWTFWKSHHLVILNDSLHAPLKTGTYPSLFYCSVKVHLSDGLYFIRMHDYACM